MGDLVVNWTNCMIVISLHQWSKMSTYSRFLKEEEMKLIYEETAFALARFRSKFLCKKTAVISVFPIM